MMSMHKDVGWSRMCSHRGDGILKDIMQSDTLVIRRQVVKLEQCSAVHDRDDKRAAGVGAQRESGQFGRVARTIDGNGVGLSSSSDSEVMTMMLARVAQGATWGERIQDCYAQVAGRLLAGDFDARWRLRDPRPVGISPVECRDSALGRACAVASETGALQTWVAK